MGFKWPELTYDLDMEAIGYPGVTVRLVLNPDPLPEGQTFSSTAWDTAYYHRQSQVIRRVFVPGEYREDGEDWTWLSTGAESLWELDHDPDFDSRILMHAASRWAMLRMQELPNARKN